MIKSELAHRKAAIKRGLNFIYRTARETKGFDSYGSLSICCFALIGATSRDPELKQLARERANELAQRWGKLHRALPSNATADLVRDFVFVRYGLSRIGVREKAITDQIQAAVRRLTVQDLLGFDPVHEPPANDLTYLCDCGLQNERGRKICVQCKSRLEIQNRYRVWMEALANSYVSERIGVRLGARYLDVLRWLPQLRPYPAIGETHTGELRDAIYAVTHVVYTLSDYATYRLSSRVLPQEFEFLKANVATACERRDPEVLGELLDSLRVLGLPNGDPLVKFGRQYLLADQNKDGSWGDPDEENIRIRCHTTWTAIDGLRTNAWRASCSRQTLAVSAGL